MAYVVGTQITLNQINAHNSTHIQVHNNASVHNDGPDYDINGVKQILVAATPTTLGECCVIFREAKRLWNTCHINRGGPPLALAHKVPDVTNVLTTDMNIGAYYQGLIFTDLKTLTLAILTSYTNHIANKKPDQSASGCHVAADTTNIVGGVDPISTFDDIAIVLNNLKLNHNNHIAFSAGGSPHPNPDAANAVTAANCYASNFDSMITLANEIKTKQNAHYTQATVHSVNDTFNTISAASVSNPGGLFDLAIEYKTKHNAHIASTTYHNSADGTNTLVYSNPTTIAGLITAATEVITKQPGHFNLCPTSNAMVQV